MNEDFKHTADDKLSNDDRLSNIVYIGDVQLTTNNPCPTAAQYLRDDIDLGP